MAVHASVFMSTTEQKPGQNRHANSIIAFIIGLSIILLASILNAAGLNLTKLDHVRLSESTPLLPLVNASTNRCGPVQSPRLQEKRIGCDHCGCSA